MKVTLVNTYASFGGASIAAQRLHEALNSCTRVQSRWLVQESGDHRHAEGFAQSGFSKLLAKGRIYGDRLRFILHEKNKQVRFAFTPAHYGANITRHASITSADIIHLHWITNGFLSPQSLLQLAALGKPVVWTLHDMWAFTGGCHYAGSCHAYTQSCGQCPYLRSPGPVDLSHSLHKQKARIYPQLKPTIVTCSAWLKSMAKASSLLQNFEIINIPNPISTEVYTPAPKAEMRKQLKLHPDKLYLLFVAHNITDQRKGFHLLLEALHRLKSLHPEWTEHLELLIMGNPPKEKLDLPFASRWTGYLKDEKLKISYYQAASAFIIPSLEDNLPNTIMESLACGTPAIGLPTGGIPEMIDSGQNGILALESSAEPLSRAIETFILQKDQHSHMEAGARAKTLKEYAYPVVAQKYLEVYNSLYSPS